MFLRLFFIRSARLAAMTGPGWVFLDLISHDDGRSEHLSVSVLSFWFGAEGAGWLISPSHDASFGVVGLVRYTTSLTSTKVSKDSVPSSSSFHSIPFH